MSVTCSSALLRVSALCLGLLCSTVAVAAVVPPYNPSLDVPLPAGVSVLSLTNHRQAKYAAATGLRNSDGHSFHAMQAATSSAPLLGCVAGSGEYSLSMYLGEQGPFRLLLDTGSSTLGVASSLCTGCPVSEYGSLWNASAAVDTDDTHHTIRNAYGNGTTSWSGSIFNTSATIETSYNQSAQGPPVRLLVVAISSQSLFFQTNTDCPTDSYTLSDFFQGIVGFGFPSLTFAGGSFIASYFQQYPSLSHEFTFQLCAIDDGQLWIGYYNSSVVSSPFQCAPILSQTYWSTQSCGVTYSNASTGQTTVLGTQAAFGACQPSSHNCSIFDSGTTLTYLPSSVYNTFVSAVRADAFYQSVFGTVNDPMSVNNTNITCYAPLFDIDPASLSAQLPTLYIQLGADSTCADSGLLTLAMPAVDGWLLRYVVPGSPTQYCPGIQDVQATLGPGFPFYIIGDSFMNNYVVRHLMSSTAPQICFAGSTGCPYALNEPSVAPPATGPGAISASSSTTSASSATSALASSPSLALVSSSPSSAPLVSSSFNVVSSATLATSSAATSSRVAAAVSSSLDEPSSSATSASFTSTAILTSSLSFTSAQGSSATVFASTSSIATASSSLAPSSSSASSSCTSSLDRPPSLTSSSPSSSASTGSSSLVPFPSSTASFSPISSSPFPPLSTSPSTSALSSLPPLTTAASSSPAASSSSPPLLSSSHFTSPTLVSVAPSSSTAAQTESSPLSTLPVTASSSIGFVLTAASSSSSSATAPTATSTSSTSAFLSSSPTSLPSPSSSSVGVAPSSTSTAQSAQLSTSAAATRRTLSFPSASISHILALVGLLATYLLMAEPG